MMEPVAVRPAPVDITLPAGPEVPVWPGDPPFSITGIGSPELRVSTVSFCLHHGTHLDAPAHCLPGGRTIDSYPVERFFVDALVVDLPGVRRIGVSHLPGPEACPGDAVLFRCAFSQEGVFDPEFPCLAIDAARGLVERRVSLVGIDSPSVERGDDPALPVHRLLLGNDVLILERLDLSRVAAGRYRLTCLPLAFAGAEAGPCRAVLWPAAAGARDRLGFLLRQAGCGPLQGAPEPCPGSRSCWVP